jgi:hypothetical protein
MKLNNNQILGLVILGAILFFIFVMPVIDSTNTKEKLTNIDTITKIDKNICSKQCCKHAQWPVPHDMKSNDIPEEQLSNYVGTNFSCNFGEGSGCLCVTKDEFNYLSGRGGNAGSTNSTCKAV